jgi:hypothetical protein
MHRVIVSLLTLIGGIVGGIAAGHLSVTFYHQQVVSFVPPGPAAPAPDPSRTPDPDPPLPIPPPEEPTRAAAPVSSAPAAQGARTTLAESQHPAGVDPRALSEVERINGTSLEELRREAERP